MRHKFKLCLLGSGGVGKTSLLYRYHKGIFQEREIASTKKVYCIKKTLNIDLDTVIVNIWDTGGQEKYHSIQPMYYRDGNGALVLYALNDSSTLERAKEWVKELRKFSPNIIITLVASKCDLRKHYQVNIEEVEKYCKRVKIKHFVTSSKANKNVKQSFLDVIKRCVIKEKRKSSNRNRNRAIKSSIVSGYTSPSRKSGIRILESDDDDDDVDLKEYREGNSYGFMDYFKKYCCFCLISN